MVYLVSHAMTDYASYLGKPVKFITCVVYLPYEKSAGNKRLVQFGYPTAH